MTLVLLKKCIMEMATAHLLEISNEDVSSNVFCISQLQKSLQIILLLIFPSVQKAHKASKQFSHAQINFKES